MSDDNGIELKQRTLPEQLRYLARKLTEPASPGNQTLRCAIIGAALEAMALRLDEQNAPPADGPDDAGFFSGGETITARFDHSDKLHKNIGRH